ncbi:MAG: kynureninase [Rhodanobacteraceae bacterium]|nr:kynureninase [Rhodanobacteraceae bacterium]
MIDTFKQRAAALDAADPLAAFRDEFHIPQHEHRDSTYLCGNSLGVQPKATRQALIDELDDWAQLGVEGHFRGRHPWMPYHELLRDGLAHVAGAEPGEVVAMNSLTANLHLMMVSFYRPTRERPAILIEQGAFPSDRYAVESQIRFHGFDPAQCLIEVAPDTDTGTISMAAIARAIECHRERLALVLWPGVQSRSGAKRMIWRTSCASAMQRAPSSDSTWRMASATCRCICTTANADFAVWCSYKYLNSGTGAVAGCFVHERHARTDRPRFAGWWGHDQSTRFRMGPDFMPTPGAEGWQLSNPPILALAPLRVSLEIFERADILQLREKSKAMTAFYAESIDTVLGQHLAILTPRDPERRGCQLSLRVRAGRERGRGLFEHLEQHGVIGDWREPDVIRVSPTPLYNRYGDIVPLLREASSFLA